ALSLKSNKFRVIYIILTAIILPLFFIFSVRKKGSWIRKLLIPSLIMGYIAYVLQHFAITWAAPILSWQQKLFGLFTGAGLYLVFYGTYSLLMKWLGKIKLKNES